MSMTNNKTTKITFILLALICSGSRANEDDAIISTYNIIKSIGGIKDEHCITYTPNKKGQSLYSVSVKEKHDGIKCPGDKYTAPTIYNVLVDEKNKVYTINEELFKESSCYKSKQHTGMQRKDALVITDSHGYLFASPTPKCKLDGVFLIKGNRVVLLGEQNGFYNIEYESKRLGVIHAWIEKKNIQEN